MINIVIPVVEDEEDVVVEEEEEEAGERGRWLWLVTAVVKG
jgi:predicted RNA-binding protein YlqC (UPF0109 family)